MTEFTTVGDLARQLVLRRQNADVRAELDRLTTEISTGRRSDLAGSLSGDFTVLAAVERDLADLAAFKTATSELEARAAAMQTSLGNVQSITEEFFPQLLAAPGIGQETYARNLAEEARVRLASVVAGLNVSFGDRTLFAGAATTGPALADSDSMLAALEAVVVGETDPAGVELAVAAWFAPGGAFDAIGYLGPNDSIAQQPVSSVQGLGIAITAEDGRIREILTGLALATLADRPPVVGDLRQQNALAARAGEALLRAQTGLSTMRGEVGAVQAELESVISRNGAEETALRVTRGNLADADVFDAATQLEAVQGQLELLYAITARSAEITLTRYL